MNTEQLKKLLIMLSYSFQDFQKYMVGKVRFNKFTYPIEDIKHFLYLKSKEKLNL